MNTIQPNKTQSGQSLGHTARAFARRPLRQRWALLGGSGQVHTISPRRRAIHFIDQRRHCLLHPLPSPIAALHVRTIELRAHIQHLSVEHFTTQVRLASDQHTWSHRVLSCLSHVGDRSHDGASVRQIYHQKHAHRLSKIRPAYSYKSFRSRQIPYLQFDMLLIE